MNTRFTLELQTEDSLEYTFKIITKEPFTQQIEWSSAAEYLGRRSLKKYKYKAFLLEESLVVELIPFC